MLKTQNNNENVQKKTKTKTNTVHTHKLKQQQQQQQQQQKKEQLSLMNHFTPKITFVFILTVWLHNSYNASLDNLVLDCLIIP